MTNKEKFIKAAKITAEEYHENTHIDNMTFCAYCKVILKSHPQRNEILIFKKCKECPMGTKLKGMGCIKMQTINKYNFNNTEERDKVRAKFHESIIPILEKIDPIFFTKRG